MSVSHSISEVVRKSGLRARCSVIENGAECLATLTEHVFSLAFIDIDLQKPEGREIISTARQAGVNTFFVAISSEKQPERVELKRSLGVFAHLPKPINRRNVARILHTYQRISAPASVLVIDKTASIRSEFQQALKSSIYNLTVDDAADADTALALYKPRRHDIVFIDLNMADQASAEIMMRIKALNVKVRFVLVSNDRGLKLTGSDGYEISRHLLHKPFFPQDVEQILDSLFDFEPPCFTKQEDNLVLL